MDEYSGKCLGLYYKDILKKSGIKNKKGQGKVEGGSGWLIFKCFLKKVIFMMKSFQNITVRTNLKDLIFSNNCFKNQLLIKQIIKEQQKMINIKM